MNILKIILLLIVEILFIPIRLIRYILLTLDLIYGSIKYDRNFKSEFADFNEIEINKAKKRIFEG